MNNINQALAGLTGPGLPQGNKVVGRRTEEASDVSLKTDATETVVSSEAVNEVKVLGSQVVDVPLETMPTLASVEKAYLLKVLAAAGGNKTKAAKVLGITLKTVYNKLDVYAKEFKASQDS